MAAELAFGADFAGHASHFRGEHVKLLDHRVDDRRGLQELALQRAAVDVEGNRLEEIAFGDRRDGAGHRHGRPQHVVDQGVDGVFHLAPGAAGKAEFDALAGPPLASDFLAHALKLLGNALVGGCNLVEGVGDLALQSVLIADHPDRKVADPHRLKRMQKVDFKGAGAVPRFGTAVGVNLAGCLVTVVVNYWCLCLDFAGQFASRLHARFS